LFRLARIRHTAETVVYVAYAACSGQPVPFPRSNNSFRWAAWKPPFVLLPLLNALSTVQEQWRMPIERLLNYRCARSSSDLWKEIRAATVYYVVANLVCFGALQQWQHAWLKLLYHPHFFYIVSSIYHIQILK
jgi:hypothetical protein